MKHRCRPASMSDFRGRLSKLQSFRPSSSEPFPLASTANCRGFHCGRNHAPGAKRRESPRLRHSLHRLPKPEISPPLQILPAFQDVVSARVQAKTLIEPANAYRSSAIPGAESKAYQIAQEAAAYSQQVVTKAQGEAASFIALAKEQATNPDWFNRGFTQRCLRKFCRNCA